MDRKILARRLILLSKSLLADNDAGYIYDPEHKKKPKGGGWTKTEKGWTQSKDKKENKSNSSDELEQAKKDVEQGNITKNERYEDPRTTKNPKSLVYHYQIYKELGSEANDTAMNLASNKHTPDEFLSGIADGLKGFSSGEWAGRVIDEIAHNPNSSPETLDKLYEKGKERFSYPGMKDNDMINSYVSSYITDNPKTSSETLGKITKDYQQIPPGKDNFDIRDRRDKLRSLINHPNTPTEAISSFANDPDPYIRKSVKNALDKRVNDKIDLSKLSPELRERVKDMNPEELKKFLGFLSRRKGKGTGNSEME